MDEHRITVKFNFGDAEVFASNAALRRYRRAGGSLSALQDVDTEGGNELDQILDKIDSFALLIQANLCEQTYSIDQIINGFDDLEEIVKVVEQIFAGVPWLTKNQ